MKIIIETQRLYLRQFINSDGYHFFHLNNDPEVIKYTGNTSFKSLDEANEFIQNYPDYKKNGFGRWAVCLKTNNEFIGWCGLKLEEDTKEIDLGYRFYKRYWGMGFATESAIASIKYGFEVLKLNRVIGRSYKANKGSIKVLQNCNLNFEKEFIYDNNPAVLYSIENVRN